MHLYCLPGRDKANFDWMRNLAKGINYDFSSKKIHKYSFWKNQSNLNPEIEINKINLIKPDFIIAKSLGSVLASMAIFNNLITPKYLVLIGVPHKVLGSEQLLWIKHLKNYHGEILFIQQESDVSGSYNGLTEIIESSRHRYEKVNGSDHKYSNVTQLQDIIHGWLASYSEQVNPVY